jgi:hypothetical protein
MKDGGQAFPDPAPREDGAQGMTLRDFFACHALAILADPSYTGDATNTARTAYDVAEAMLAEREKRQ